MKILRGSTEHTCAQSGPITSGGTTVEGDGSGPGDTPGDRSESLRPYL